MLHECNTHAANPSPRFPVLPLRPKAGAGFKPEHFNAIHEVGFETAFFEIHAENYMGMGGAPHAQLAALRQNHSLSVHGVGLSIGSPGGLDMDHVSRLKAVIDRYEPSLVSEHLAWSTHDDTYYNDLLPLPYTNETLDLVCRHLDEVQTALKRAILLENPSTYVCFENADMDECEFITAIARRSGCGLLLDVNNVHVSATNHQFDAFSYLNRFPLHHVKEVHLAGHAPELDGLGLPLLIDTHDRPVDDAVWALFAHVIGNTGPLPTLIEWDNDVPQWPVLVSEMQAANSIMDDIAHQPLLGRRHA